MRSGAISVSTQSTVFVIATTFEGTRAALLTAIPLAKGSCARLVVLAPQVVPYPLPVDRPVDSTSFALERYRDLIQELDGQAQVRVCLCRHADDVVWRMLPARSTVVVGGPAGTWRASREERLARRLTHLGHHVIFAPIDEKPSERDATYLEAVHSAIGELGARRYFAVFLTAIALGAVPRAASAQSPTNDQLLQRIAALETQLAELKALVNARPAPESARRVEATPDAAQAEVRNDKNGQSEDALKSLTVGVSLDTYYAFNFNQPIGRVNLLRAYDVTSNNFTLSQASLVLESAPDVEAGRRFGGRIDLQYGQATETLQGSLANEPRPWVYRNIFQAYGTYLFPLGTGLNVDFGKWASSLGVEANYNKDQWNYSRSYWFNYLPFYHMGLRTNYRVNDAVAVNYWLHNGTQQTEAFNNYKDQMFGLVINPVKSVTWTTNFHLGQEHPDVQLIVTPGPPTLPTQPGLSVVPIDPAPDGRTHIFDSYATWQATPKTIFAFEGDYIVSRMWETPGPDRSTAPSHVYGGAVYARQQLTKKAAIAGRAEYLLDKDGLFSGASQSLKETTLTYEHRVGDGLLLRGEWRRDFSNIPFFLTSESGVLETDQNTATLGMIWWWGTKRGAW